MEGLIVTVTSAVLLRKKILSSSVTALVLSLPLVLSKAGHGVQADDIVMDIGRHIGIGPHSESHILKGLCPCPSKKQCVVGKFKLHHSRFAIGTSHIGPHHAVADEHIVQNFDRSGKMCDEDCVVTTVEKKTVLNCKRTVRFRIEQRFVNGGILGFAFRRRNCQHAIGKTLRFSLHWMIAVCGGMIENETINQYTGVRPGFSCLYSQRPESRPGGILLVFRTEHGMMH